MVKKENIRKKLNLTQENMAMILKISRSQWALFELGLKELSTDALIRINQIERYFLSKEVSVSKYSNSIETKELLKNKLLADLLKDNEHQQIKCKRRLERLKKDHDGAFMQLQLIDFLSEPSDAKYALHPGAIQIIKDKVEKSLNEKVLLQIFTLQIKEQLLQQEELLLSRFLKESGDTYN